MQVVIRIAHLPCSHLIIQAALICAGLLMHNLMFIHLSQPACNYIRIITAR